MSKPKDINQVISHSQIGSDKQQQKPCKSWSKETEALVLGVFARFGDLFGNKCKASGIEIKAANGEYTSTFKLWCKKLEEASITVEDVSRGIKHLEEYIRDSVRTDKEVWPCSYAEFIGHCQKQKEREEYRTWFGLPKTKLKPEENKKKLAEMRKKLGL